ncbi:hypothetical protein [Mastigocoleus testarum]|uniref:hypothetical protein n=1 Tax=Mastigocoleus testarum TaxID=996925 RepID=UPI00190FE7B3|nr:hypothetical protein [Mastigocoleus testarum]
MQTTQYEVGVWFGCVGVNFGVVDGGFHWESQKSKFKSQKMTYGHTALTNHDLRSRYTSGFKRLSTPN